MKKIDARTARATSQHSPTANIGRVTAIDTSIGPRPVQGTFPIVGVGASAGGLEAFSNLLKQIEIDHSGMALVLVQHLDPTHTSLLSELLLQTTTMPVEQAEDGMRVEPGHVYVIPPNTCLGICDGLLTLAPRAKGSKASYLPVDHFFRALAAERGSRAIGVVLSGTASDGTEGLRAIKEASGITFAQEPASAKFSGMPSSALNAGVVDYCLPIPELAQEVLRLSQHPYVTAPEAPPSRDAAMMHKLFELVQAVTRVDFSEYEAQTFARRLARRMALRRVDTLAEYLTFLERTPEEVVALCEDALIRVTSFFRDPEVFELLKAQVFPAIMSAKSKSTSVRMWVAGCATGEEVYSLAIALAEFLDDSSRPIQIFGTDISSKAIEMARTGTYPDGALRHLTDERRRRHFTKVEHGHRITKSIRDQCVFVRHDLARDPPFAKLDLVSCRNVFIYFDQALQKRVVQTFHYALGEPGFLLLGRAENISEYRSLFRVKDKTHKIFTRTSIPSTLRFAHRSEVRSLPVRSPREIDNHEGDLSRRVDRLLLARYAPPGVVVNEKMEVLQFRGKTRAFLEPAPGGPQNNAMQMARGRLAVALHASLAQARKSAAPTRTSGSRSTTMDSRRPATSS